MLSSAHIDGLVQERRNSIANALELHLSVADPLIYLYKETSLYPSVFGSMPIQGSDGPDSKVHGANMWPTWVLSAPDGPHVGTMNLAIRWVITVTAAALSSVSMYAAILETDSSAISRQCW